MRRAVVLGLSAVLALGVLALAAGPVQAGGRKVEYTFSAAYLGPLPEVVPGIVTGGGGALFDDGSVRGNLAISAGQGQFIAHVYGTEWTETILNGAPAIWFCFTVHFIKPMDMPDEADCLPAPVTGGPLFFDLDGDGKADWMIRISPVN
ncbi:MAG: hypothetical protein GTO63_00990 [Anaerolineae bacterium]|nr:hypothetical protein [Anaerolineae bacterium]NIN93608.1 hypothetical protein [Anaerolineae bacterium]